MRAHRNPFFVYGFFLHILFRVHARVCVCVLYCCIIRAGWWPGTYLPSRVVLYYYTTIVVAGRSRPGTFVDATHVYKRTKTASKTIGPVLIERVTSARTKVDPRGWNVIIIYYYIVTIPYYAHLCIIVLQTTAIMIIYYTLTVSTDFIDWPNGGFFLYFYIINYSL